MPVRLGAHSPKIAAVRALSTAKGRREQGRYAFEGPTLIAEALRAGASIAELYVTEAAAERLGGIEAFESAGTAVYLVDERTAGKLSMVESPTHALAVAPSLFEPLGRMLGKPGTVLVLAGLNDPGNAGTLLRSADAFGAAGVVFGRDGVEPYHPKTVRAAMGSLFRLPPAVAAPEDFEGLAAGRPVVGLAGDGMPLRPSGIPKDAILVIGHERHGLGPWERICTERIAIPMRGGAESLNAAIAGSIALYEAAKGSV